MGCSHGRRHTCSSSNEHPGGGGGGGCGIGTIAAAIAATSGDGAGRDGDDRPARGDQGRAQGLGRPRGHTHILRGGDSLVVLVLGVHRPRGNERCMSLNLHGASTSFCCKSSVSLFH